MQILVKDQNFKEPSNKKKKTYGRETETNKEKRQKFQWTEEMVEYSLDSLKRYKVMCDFSEREFDTDETVRHSKLRKEMGKKYEGTGKSMIQQMTI